MENVTTWFVEVLIKKVAPTAIASAMALLLSFLLAHQGILEQWGVTFGMWPLHWPVGSEPSGQVILIELDTISKMMIVGIPSLVASLFVLFGHHGKATVTGAPQSGDLRRTPDVAVSGGNRAGDPPAGGQS